MTEVSTALATVRGWTGEQTPWWPFLFYSLTHTLARIHTHTLTNTSWKSVMFCQVSEPAGHDTHGGQGLEQADVSGLSLVCMCTHAWDNVCGWQRCMSCPSPKFALGKDVKKKNWKESSRLSTLLMRFLCAMQWLFLMDFIQYWMVCPG